MDGLTNFQESVIGTSPTLKDTDGDGYSDLEEIARKSDPFDGTETPVPGSNNMGIFATAKDGTLAACGVMFIEGGGLLGLSFQWGVVINGVPMLLPPSVTQSASTLTFHQAKSASDQIIMVRTVFPQSLLESLGSFSVWGRLTDSKVSGSAVADVLTLTMLGGVPTTIEPAPDHIQNGGGVVYNPLDGGDDVPSNWTGGKICWQQAVPVGTNGATTIHEVEYSSCEELDTYCSPSDCNAAVGGTVEMVDPAILAGG